MTQNHLLDIQNLTYKKNNRTLLDDVSFNIASGEVVGIIGPNGAGKSTLLKTIVGFYHASSGNVLLRNTPLKFLSHHQRALDISYLAQHPEASFPFTASETIALGTYNRQLSSPEHQDSIQQQIHEIAHQLEITHLLNRKLTELSGGEAQLVHFARIYSQKAPLILLDEPTANLDIGHEAQLMNVLRRHCQGGQSAIVALHNLNIAATFCDRLLLMNRGKLISSGTPEQVITAKNMSMLYGQQVIVNKHPQTDAIIILPVRES